MKITFDPFDAADKARVMQFLDTDAQTPTTADDTGATAPDEWPQFSEQYGVDVDSNGSPHIPDVHATTKAVNADGTWRKKRGTDDDAVSAAEQEARAKLTETPATTPEHPPVEVEQSTVAPVSFEQVIEKYHEKAEAGAINPAMMMELYAKHGTSAQALATDETARAAIFADLDALTAPSLPGFE